ncbi:hypothetical protein KUV80_09635 [Fictibacillus nanhaiensis]|uniref:hypothetical protein n=1 Tax=Fictibacillus nanhaiensis TaxID=742169 RepID=UPI001C976D40|nr:hypothetical protein [Fictibacillus nanhaiensis]MBY6036916.1 hypothetical protein [Fictibacillus nanhaiensis]
MLFHYHFWTPYVEETEKFYKDHGFRVSLRIGKCEGEFQPFNPPLTWDDFREKNILFRIIEVRKGKVNITFGYGKKPMFDHIGLLVSIEEHNKICDNAKKMKWEVKVAERRTFITTPYKFRIELQTHSDVIDTTTDITEIEELKMVTKIKGLEDDLSILFSQPVKTISSEVGDEVTIKEAVIRGLSPIKVDPNGVRIVS